MVELNYIEAPPMLEQIIARTGSLGFNMASELLTGALLRTLAASKPKGRFLELGTGTGIAQLGCWPEWTPVRGSPP